MPDGADRDNCQSSIHLCDPKGGQSRDWVCARNSVETVKQYDIGETGGHRTLQL